MSLTSLVFVWVMHQGTQMTNIWLGGVGLTRHLANTNLWRQNRGAVPA